MKHYPTPLALILDSPRHQPAGYEVFAGLKPSGGELHENILRRAYAIWENEGHPANRQLSHWLKAEAEFMRL